MQQTTYTNGLLFDDLVGNGEQLRWKGETERPRGLQIDDELEFIKPQYWQVSRLLAFENDEGAAPPHSDSASVDCITTMTYGFQVETSQ